MFQQNEGLLDRVIRALVGIALLIAALWLTGLLATIFFILGLILLVTSALGYCGLYSICHFNTIDKKVSTEAKPASTPASNPSATPQADETNHIEPEPETMPSTQTSTDSSQAEPQN